MKIRLLYVISHSKRWISFEWLSQSIDRDKFDVFFIILNKGQSPLVNYLETTSDNIFHIKFTKAGELWPVIWKIRHFCKEYKIDIIHTHFGYACIAGLIGGCLAGVKNRIHTRHYAGPYPSENRPIFQWLELLVNTLSTKIIAPSKQVRKSLIGEGVAEDKIIIIHHGFDLNVIQDVPKEIIQEYRDRYQLYSSGPIIGVVARYLKGKGVHYIIPAFRKLLSIYPSAQLVLVHASGRDSQRIKEQLSEIPETSYIETAYEENIFPFYQLFDVFVHVPISPEYEAFGQVCVEALAAGVPCIFTKAGITSEYMEHKRHAWIVEHQNSEQIYAGICNILTDNVLRNTMVNNGLLLVKEKFGLENMIKSLESLYLDIC